MRHLVCAGLSLALLLPAFGQAAARDLPTHAVVEAPIAPDSPEASSGASAADRRVAPARALRVPALLVARTVPIIAPPVGELRDRRDEVLRAHPGQRLPRLQDYDEDH